MVLSLQLRFQLQLVPLHLGALPLLPLQSLTQNNYLVLLVHQLSFCLAEGRLHFLSLSDQLLIRLND